MKKVVLLFVLLLAFSFSYASNGLVEKLPTLNNTETTIVNQVVAKSFITDKAPASESFIVDKADTIYVYRCTYIGGGWWKCVLVGVIK